MHCAVSSHCLPEPPVWAPGPQLMALLLGDVETLGPGSVFTTGMKLTLYTVTDTGRLLILCFLYSKDEHRSFLPERLWELAKIRIKHNSPTCILLGLTHYSGVLGEGWAMALDCVNCLILLESQLLSSALFFGCSVSSSLEPEIGNGPQSVFK